MLSVKAKPKQANKTSKRLEVTPELIEGFQAAFLWKNFDAPVSTPECHREWWRFVTSKDRHVAIAAPRNHAKSTAVTHTATMAMICFREIRHVLIVSDTEAQAVTFLNDIKNEFLENEALRSSFKPHKIVKDNETEFIFLWDDGGWVRLIARGGGQKLRGMKYRHKRPDYVICDDMENDDAVQNKEIRNKFSEWFYGALLPVISRAGRIRVVGTVLHFDGLLMRLINSKKWKTKLYEAHNDDFSVILWPEQWSESALREQYEVFAADGKTDQYYREFRNKPLSDTDRILPPEKIRDFPDNLPPLEYYACLDAASSSKDRRDYTAIVIIGLDHAGKAYIRHVTRERMDPHATVSAMFELQSVFEPIEWLIESGTLKNMLLPLIEMYGNELGTYLPISSDNLTPTKDKEFRSKPFSGRIKAGTVYADKKSSWWETFKAELEQFPAVAHDDQVDAAGLLFWKLNNLVLAKTREQAEEDYLDSLYEHEDDDYSTGLEFGYGRDSITGY